MISYRFVSQNNIFITFIKIAGEHSVTTTLKDYMLNKLLTLARIFSLDVVLGACVGNLFIARYLQVSVPVLHLLALALSVWLIYTADHLADAYQVKHPAHSPRHFYHQQHFRAISIVFIMLLLLGLVLVFNLPHKTIIWGMALSGLVLVYFILIKVIPSVRYFYKEFLIAFLYTSGIFLSPVSFYSHPISFEILFVFVQYAVIALANLLIFALYEAEMDEKDGHRSFIKSVGKKKAKAFVYTCLLIVFFSALISVITTHTADRLFKIELFFLLMNSTLICIMALPAFFQKKERYRMLGDAIFLFPIFTLI